MLFATWNVNGLRARLDFVLAWLAERQPDVVGFQELKLPDEKFPHAELEAAGYHAAVHGQKSWNGVAILAREEVVATQVGLPGEEEMGSRLISAQVGDVSFSTVYVPNGKDLDHDDFGRKLAWLDTLADHLDQRDDPTAPYLICGDFNVCPTPLDTWAPERGDESIFHTTVERERIAKLSSRGLADVWREHHPEARDFSWWDYRGGSFPRNHGLRIDFLFANEAVRSRVVRCEIDRDWRKKRDGLTASDHAPVWLELG